MQEIAQGTVPVTEANPAPTPPADFTNVPALSDVDVRRAIEQAESKGIDPNALTVSEMAEFQKTENPPKAADSQRISPDQVFNPNAVRLEVPDQFRGKDGEADVEKIKASTEELQKATKEKEEAIQKSMFCIFSMENKIVKSAQVMDAINVAGPDPRFDRIAALKYNMTVIQGIDEASKWFLNIPLPMMAPPAPDSKESSGMKGGPNGNDPSFLPQQPLAGQPVVQ